jgi:CRP-like cAMP-binding protein
MSTLQLVEPLRAQNEQRSANRLLAGLPADEYQRISSDLASRPLNVRQTLHKHGERLSEIYFPGRSVCSITQTMEDGGVVEVAAVGKEGLVGIGAVFGDTVVTGHAFIQVNGDAAQVMTIEAFRREMSRKGPFYDVITRYSRAFVGLVMQSTACNGLHSAEQRCCRWLLETEDRIERDEFEMTHEFLAITLGVRRPTVTLVLAELQRAGIVAHGRGHVKITDRMALEAVSCECYRTVKQLFNRLMP